MSIEPTLPAAGATAALPPRLRLLLATADTATLRNDRILGVQCILQIFAGFDRSAPWDTDIGATRDAA
jgi:hypothetical protein